MGTPARYYDDLGRVLCRWCFKCIGDLGPRRNRCYCSSECAEDSRRERNLVHGRAAYRRSPETFNARSRLSWANKERRFQRYGTDKATMLEMLEAQGGRCPLCSSVVSLAGGHAGHIDHCHETGGVRGILCRRCNVGIGYFEGDPEWLVRALEYLGVDDG